ncbi:MAG: kynureninase [Anaerolineae bacterium]|nr:kynureninase [Phycisphaerae bacterium]
MHDFLADESFAKQQDQNDPLRAYRSEFHIPRHGNGQEIIYLAGNSLGLMPKKARTIVDQELDDWQNLAVEAHFAGKTPWYGYHEVFRESGARLVGAKPGEVVMMNSLTVNLHLLFASFFRPTLERYKLLIEDPCFPSDNYAVRTHLQTRGLDAREALLIAKPRNGRATLSMDEFESIFARQGKEIALVWMSGVNFLTGQVFDMQRITALAKKHGCVVGWDLAHGAGNIITQLHDWDVDFAAWCSYKYLNSGPGSIAGAFIHQKHGGNPDIPRYAGWWGNDPATRFRMQLEPDFEPRKGADGWQISNPPILSMAPLQASLEIFDRATMPAVRAKSIKLTAYLRYLLERSPSFGENFDITTPRETEAQGCQLSIVVHENAKAVQDALCAAGATCDFREPNVIRAAPTPLYNTFHECWRFVRIFESCLDRGMGVSPVLPENAGETPTPR